MPCTNIKHTFPTNNIFSIALVKKKKKKTRYKARTRWCRRPLRLIYQWQIFFNMKKELTETIEKIIELHKCITANISAIWQHAARTTDQLTSPSCLTRAIQKKSLFLNEKY